MPNMTRAGSSSDNLSELVYQQIKNDIFDFKLMPGERFTESEIALNYQVSRTPARQALYRLQQEGYVEVAFRSGWTVRPLNLQYYDELYELRIMIEQYAIRKLCSSASQPSKEIKHLHKMTRTLPTYARWDGKKWSNPSYRKHHTELHYTSYGASQDNYWRGFTEKQT